MTEDARPPAQPLHDERLGASWVLWAVAFAFAGSLGLAYGARVSALAGLAALVSSAGLAVIVLLVSATRITVDGEGIHAGGALLPGWACGRAVPLDAEAAARLRGRDADPRAWMVLRGWVSTAVRVEVEDPADVTPYWYLSTRRPAELAAAIDQVSAFHRAQRDPEPR